MQSWRALTSTSRSLRELHESDSKTNSETPADTLSKGRHELEAHTTHAEAIGHTASALGGQIVYPIDRGGVDRRLEALAYQLQ